jgi:hypothetical protein
MGKTARSRNAIDDEDNAVPMARRIDEIEIGRLRDVSTAWQRRNYCDMNYSNDAFGSVYVMIELRRLFAGLAALI